MPEKSKKQCNIYSDADCLMLNEFTILPNTSFIFNNVSMAYLKELVIIFIDYHKSTRYKN